MDTFYNKMTYLKEYENDVSLIISFDFVDREDIERLNLEVDDDFRFKVDYELKGYIKVGKFDGADCNYADEYNLSLIKSNLDILNTADYIKNICVQYSIGADRPSELKYVPDILFLEFMKLLPSVKSLTINLCKSLPKNISHIMDTLASLFVNLQELNIFTNRSDFPKELISFKDTQLKKIYLGANQYNKKFPKFLYEFSLTLEELILDYCIKELPKDIEKFEKLRYLSISDSTEDLFPKNFEKMKLLKAIRLDCLDEFPDIPDNLVSGITYLEVNGDNFKNLDKIKKYINLEALGISSIFRALSPEVDKNIECYNDIIEDEKEFYNYNGNEFNSSEDIIENLFSNTKLGYFPIQILELKKLKKLSLALTNITYIPAEIIQLSELEYLDLSYTKLESLPVEINELKNLKYLNIHGSTIKLNSEELNCKIYL